MLMYIYRDRGRERAVMDNYSVIKKNEIMPFAVSWMDLEIIRRSEVSQTETNIKYHLYVKS